MKRLLLALLATVAADADGVSGANFTSQGYRASLPAALDAAGLIEN